MDHNVKGLVKPNPNNPYDDPNNEEIYDGGDNKYNKDRRTTFMKKDRTNPTHYDTYPKKDQTLKPVSSELMALGRLSSIRTISQKNRRNSSMIW